MDKRRLKEVMRCWSMDAGLVGGRSIYDRREREMIFCFEICDIYSVKGDKVILVK